VVGVEPGFVVAKADLDPDASIIWPALPQRRDWCWRNCWFPKLPVRRGCSIRRGGFAYGLGEWVGAGASRRGDAPAVRPGLPRFFDRFQRFLLFFGEVAAFGTAFGLGLLDRPGGFF
jgi:hypothetical protein